MPNFSEPLPLSLYIHIPWCVKKCPYCDFNSHQAKSSIPEDLYVEALLADLANAKRWVQNRPIISIFFGGGTPSLFSAQAIHRILNELAQHLTFSPTIEITLEANPGTVDQVRFSDFYKAGINRLSLGIQSFQDDKLKTLGRIHDSEHAKRAIISAKEAGFTNFNLDLMYGLPHQSLEEALEDLQTALSFEPSHLSWYQLTLEPNTLFHHQPPILPNDDAIWDMQIAGQNALSDAGFPQYEVSAYAKPNKECLHNRNYWEFGDYLGIGAGAHSKITDIEACEVNRFAQVKQPKEYMLAVNRQPTVKNLSAEDLIFEFMLNALRLTDGFSKHLFLRRTGILLNQIEAKLTKATHLGLLLNETSRVKPSLLGLRFLNNLTEIFL